jgi:hypothetical protein
VRQLGVAILGLIGGLLVGFLVHDVVARVALAGDGQLSLPLPLALFLGFFIPVMAVVGLVVALAIDRRRRQQAGRAGRYARHQTYP